MDTPFLDRLDQLVDFVVGYLQLRAPKLTGNLAINAIRKAYDDNGIPFIVVGGEAAPYAIYTNEPWIAERWRGAVNPNQGWIWTAVNDCVPIIQSYMSGEMSEDDLYNLNVKNRIGVIDQLQTIGAMFA